jgi:hypothetical protein
MKDAASTEQRHQPVQSRTRRTASPPENLNKNTSEVNKKETESPANQPEVKQRAVEKEITRPS